MFSLTLNYVGIFFLFFFYFSLHPLTPGAKLITQGKNNQRKTAMKKLFTTKNVTIALVSIFAIAATIALAVLTHSIMNPKVTKSYAPYVAAPSASTATPEPEDTYLGKTDEYVSQEAPKYEVPGHPGVYMTEEEYLQSDYYAELLREAEAYESARAEKENNQRTQELLIQVCDEVRAEMGPAYFTDADYAECVSAANV